MPIYQSVRSNFERIGARSTVRRFNPESGNRLRRTMAIDVVHDDAGECFDIQLSNGVGLEVLDIRRRQRHLLLSAWSIWGEDRFLCGHDEFHWFVAALPGQPEDVASAKESLKPELVKTVEQRKRRGKHYRKSDVFMRQGEWFFIPWRHAKIDWDRVERNAPLIRGVGSKPHVCEFLYRDGVPEYECDRYPRMVFSETECREMLRTRRKAKQWNWRRVRSNSDIYMKGWVTHPDHSPFHFDVWHRVVMNRESTDLATSRMIYRD